MQSRRIKSYIPVGSWIVNKYVEMLSYMVGETILCNGATGHRAWMISCNKCIGECATICMCEQTLSRTTQGIFSEKRSVAFVCVYKHRHLSALSPVLLVDRWTTVDWMGKGLFSPSTPLTKPFRARLNAQQAGDKAQSRGNVYSILGCGKHDALTSTLDPFCSEEFASHLSSFYIE